ncbi:6-pyruvoyl tetrahydropterin synthase [Pseudomaricurvus alcaniphilus]|uniref:6-pyruvoyl trahydropterin synthase family protein n=1 Tax=Pseudomaricurvus alcaniphilus TaxID=1166482 RepID=UPI00140ABCD4|nr:6-carboxytetrahydropterin synthase [Pseudomaricurvus alcaniphilus]NHN39342.1 6-pyruvoyl tetrahydropterin synthase [Pseudomaricurvus alcaniphilus]
MERLTTITLAKEYQKFSAAHFTIFSATERERLHGHNFSVTAALTVPVGDDGLCFSYRIYKDILKQVCEQLDEYVLIPSQSPHLQIRSEGAFYHVEFNGETMPLLKSDTILLPIRNTTVEEFSHYILEKLLQVNQDGNRFDIRALEVRVFSGPGQCGSSSWAA